MPPGNKFAGNHLDRLRQAIFAEPLFRRDRDILLLSLILVWLLGAGAHMLDYPKWNAPPFMVDGEFIQATHDAYHWLAGAEGLGKGADRPLSVLCREGSRLLGVSPGNFAFFATAVAAGLAGVAVTLLAWIAGGLEAGILAGLFTVLAPGFYYRTRLGYYDTDMVTLLFPLLLTFGLALWLRPHLYSSWKGGLALLLNKEPPAQDETASQPPGAAGILGMLVFGGFARFCELWHGRIDLYALLLSSIAFVLILLLALPGRRGALLLGLAIFALCALLERTGMFAALGLALLALVWPRFLPLFTRSAWPGAVLVVAVLLMATLAQGLLFEGGQLLELYGNRPALESSLGTDSGAAAPAATAKESNVQWPQTMQSVVEAQTIDWGLFLLRIHPWKWLALAGLAGFIAALFFRPLLLFLAPFLVLSLCAVALGSRLAMFAGPAAAIGLALPLCWLFRYLLPPDQEESREWRRPVLCCCLTLAALLFLTPSVKVFAALTPAPVLDKAHVQALKKLQTLAPEQAMVWTWWDWGYATLYYARRPGFADGGEHSGRRIYPLALALTSSSSLQASQIMRYSAQQGYAPWKTWERLPPAQLQEFITGLKTPDNSIAAPAPQYLVVSIENIHLLHWMTYYGSWNFIQAQGTHANVVLVDKTFDLNYEQGILTFPDSGNSIPLSSIDVIVPEKYYHSDYPKNPGGRHLFVHKQSGRFYILDDRAYYSQNVQLLLRDPEAPDISKSFRLVHDGFPIVRIYEAL